ncbi:SPOCS domain-containing protein [Desulfothermobacter acidiphilus]|uniref:SPOCS domain-containing protein n=1 Tax=Desulfothermobacter acidiphilus TaxID=1938353 RepID=UPI003F8B2319
MSCAGKYLLLKLNQVLAEASTREPLERELALRPEDPEVDTLLSLRTEAQARSVQVLDGRVVWDGTLELRLSYVACRPSKPVYVARLFVPVSGALEFPAARPGMTAAVRLELPEVVVRPEKKGGRRLRLAALLIAHGKLTSLKELEVLEEAPPGFQVKKRRLRVETVVASARAQYLGSREERLPVDKPALCSVEHVQVNCHRLQAEACAGEVRVSGEIELQILYAAATDACPLYETRYLLPWEQLILLAGATAGLEAQVDEVKAEAKVRPKGELPTRTLELEVLVNFRVLLGKTVEAEVVTEVEGGAKTHKSRVWVDRVLAKKEKEEKLIQEVASPIDPPVAKVVTVEPVLATVTSVESLDGTALIKGKSLVRVIYVATGTGRVHALDVFLPLTSSCTLPEAAPERQIVATIDPVRADACLSERRELRVEEVVRLKVRVMERVQEEVVTCLELPAANDRLVAYTINQGDTLYLLAQRFGTTVEAIMACNPGLDPYNLQVGQVIYLPCRS